MAHPLNTHITPNGRRDGSGEGGAQRSKTNADKCIGPKQAEDLSLDMAAQQVFGWVMLPVVAQNPRSSLFHQFLCRPEYKSKQPANERAAFRSRPKDLFRMKRPGGSALSKTWTLSSRGAQTIPSGGLTPFRSARYAPVHLHSPGSREPGMALVSWLMLASFWCVNLCCTQCAAGGRRRICRDVIGSGRLWKAHQFGNGREACYISRRNAPLF